MAEIVLSKDFISQTREAVEFLDRIKLKCDKLDNHKPAFEDQKAFIAEHNDRVFGFLNAHFSSIWDTVKDLGQDKYRAHQKFYQAAIGPYFLVSPFNTRVYEKPLGYPGDYKMMLYLYDDGYEGDGTFAKLMHRYSMSVPVAVANNRRRLFYEKMIRDAIRSSAASKISSIACGPAFEILELLRESPAAASAHFTCIDFEQEALDFLSERIKRIESSVGLEFNVSLINRNIKSVLSYRRMGELITDQDLIYSSGLIDYFDDRLAARLIEVLFGLLKNDGVLVVGNVSSDNPSRGYMEFLGEWKLNHRSADHLIGLAQSLEGRGTVRVELEPITGMNVFLVVKKNA